MNNFYTPLRTQIDVAVSEGFIQPINLSLLKIVDLQEGDGHEDWGKRCMEALEDWKWEVRLLDNLAFDLGNNFLLAGESRLRSGLAKQEGHRGVMQIDVLGRLHAKMKPT